MKFKLPKLPHLPRLNIEPLKKIGSHLISHKILITVFIFLIALVATSVWFRGYLAAKIKPSSENSGNDIFYAKRKKAALKRQPPLFLGSFFRNLLCRLPGMCT